ncbi:MAG: hypothetical protein OHK93_006074 [Ramalina farinacea]|uniref:Uncharacterized protein n=1 Tax=Ramalina farinacea TaxID=258253 RepID=A0AA43TWF3_9LECA|nr:hypothetical protein [Ramalina farinacea]
MGAPQRLVAGGSALLCIAVRVASGGAIGLPLTPRSVPDGFAIVSSGIATPICLAPAYANVSSLVADAAAANASATSSTTASLPVSLPVTLTGNSTMENSTIVSLENVDIDIICLPHAQCVTFPADLRDCWHVLKALTETPGWPRTDPIKFTTSQKDVGFLVPHRWGPDEGPKKSCKVELIEDMELMRLVDDEFSLQLLSQYAGQIIKKCVKENPTGDGPYGGSALIGDKQVFRVNVLGVPTASTPLPTAAGNVVTGPGATS